jgi:hypothetical protein
MNTEQREFIAEIYENVIRHKALETTFDEFMVNITECLKYLGDSDLKLYDKFIDVYDSYDYFDDDIFSVVEKEDDENFDIISDDSYEEE